MYTSSDTTGSKHHAQHIKEKRDMNTKTKTSLKIKRLTGAHVNYLTGFCYEEKAQFSIAGEQALSFVAKDSDHTFQHGHHPQPHFDHPLASLHQPRPSKRELQKEGGLSGK